MTITAKIKLVPSGRQSSLLMDTLEGMNRACNHASVLVHNNQVFDRTRLHRLSYYELRQQFKLKSQMAIRCIGKVVDSYKVRAKKAEDNKAPMRQFRLKGAVPFDCRMLTFDMETETLSILTLEGREEMPFQVGERGREALKHQKGESDLFFSNGAFFLNVCCQVPEEQQIECRDVIGIDLGICQLATTSDGKSFDGKQIETVHKRNQAARDGLQKKGTKAAKRKLKKISGREKRFKRDTNHQISKSIVEQAKRTGCGIALEELTGIRKRQRVSKKLRSRFSGWSFSQLRAFISYKAQIAGVPVFLVPPAYTSQRCNACEHIDRKNRKSQSEFQCCKCGHTDHADINAAKNIKLLGCRQSTYGRIVGFIRQ